MLAYLFEFLMTHHHVRYLIPLLPQLNWRQKHQLLGSQPGPPKLPPLAAEEEIVVGKLETSVCSDPLPSLSRFTSPLCPPRPEHCSAHLGSGQSPHFMSQDFASHFCLFVYGCYCFARCSGIPLDFFFFVARKVNSGLLFLSRHCSIPSLGILTTL